MKRIIISSLLFAGLFLTSCNNIVDHTGYSFYVWENKSDYQITMSLSGRIDFENEIIPLNGSLEKECDGLGVTPPPQASFDEMTIDFGDGVKVIYGSGPASEEYDRRYDPRFPIGYTFEEVKNPHGCKKCPGARWTYTFTNADYEAAKKLSQGKE